MWRRPRRRARPARGRALARFPIPAGSSASDPVPGQGSQPGLCVRAGDHAHGQRLGRLAAKRKAENRREHDREHEDPEHRLGRASARERGRGSTHERAADLVGRRPQPSRNLRPVRAMKTSSSAAMRAQRGRLDAPLRQRRQQRGDRAMDLAHRQPPDLAVAHDLSTVGSAPERSLVDRRGAAIPDLELDDVLGAERGDQLARRAERSPCPDRRRRRDRTGAPPPPCNASSAAPSVRGPSGPRRSPRSGA